jgi:hypothetical protein
MINLIVGPKGSGKTKELVDLVVKAVEEEHGDVVCIEKDRNLTFDIPYQARLIYASDYNIGTFEFMKGFISGLRAGNYDITHIFIDNFHKLFSEESADEVSCFLDWVSEFGEKEEVRFTISITADPDNLNPEISKYL